MVTVVAIAKVQTRTFHTVKLIEVTGSKRVHFLFIDKFDFRCLVVRHACNRTF